MEKKLLLIEDDNFISDIYKRSLGNAKYIVETAEDGEAGLMLAKTQKYDLILLDIMLPKITGIDILKTLRTTENLAKNTPIILITNLGDEKIINEALSLGANGYLLKVEITPQELVAKINEFFNNLK